MHVGFKMMGFRKELPGPFLSILAVFTLFQPTAIAAADNHLSHTDGSPELLPDQPYSSTLPPTNGAVNFTVESSQKLSGLLRAKLLVNIANADNTAILKEQLLSFSQSLQLFIESSHHGRTFNQVADSLRALLTWSGNHLEASTIRNMATESPSEGAAACLAQPMTGKRLLKWLRPFEKLLIFVGDERVNLESNILDKRLQEAISEINEEKMRTEQNLTNLIELQAVLLSSLQEEKDREAKIANDTGESMKRNCWLNVTFRYFDYQAKIRKIASNIRETENRLKEKLLQEKLKTSKEASVWDGKISAQSQALVNERNRLPVRLQDLRRKEADRNITLQRQHQGELVNVQEACKARKAEKTSACIQSSSNLNRTNSQQKLSLQRESQLKVTACRRTITELDTSCNQNLTSIRSIHEQQRQRLRNQMEVLEWTCTRAHKEIDDYWRTEVAKAQVNASNALSQLRSDMNTVNEDCRRQIRQIDEQTTHRKNSLRNDFHRDTSNTESRCNALVARAKQTSHDSFTSDRAEYIRRWESSGSCCYADGGYCKDGTEGTPCCSTESCTYVFLRARCCRCGRLCRM